MKKETQERNKERKAIKRKPEKGKETRKKRGLLNSLSNLIFQSHKKVVLLLPE